MHLGLNDSNNSCPLSDSSHFATTNVYNYMRERERERFPRAKQAIVNYVCIILSNSGLFFVIFVFSIQLTINVQCKFCQCLDLNRGPLE